MTLDLLSKSFICGTLSYWEDKEKTVYLITFLSLNSTLRQALIEYVPFCLLASDKAYPFPVLFALFNGLLRRLSHLGNCFVVTRVVFLCIALLYNGLMERMGNIGLVL